MLFLLTIPSSDLENQNQKVFLRYAVGWWNEHFGPADSDGSRKIRKTLWRYWVAFLLLIIKKVGFESQ